MTEIWIRPNRRALALGFVVPAALLAAGGAALALGQWQGNGQLPALAVVLAVAGIVVAWVLYRMMLQPRIAYRSGELLIDAGLKEPLSVPIEAVECFFLGQAGGMIPDSRGREAEVRTVIVRLAESATDWHHRDVKAAVAHWCEGYITIRGTWCEPITPELMKHLNSRLVAVQREHKARQLEAQI